MLIGCSVNVEEKYQAYVVCVAVVVVNVLLVKDTNAVLRDVIGPM